MANVGKGIGGAASGAATGAMAGSVVPGIGTVVGGVVGGVAGLIGGLFGGGDDHEEEMLALQQEAMDAIKNVDVPRLEQLKLALQPYKEAGVLTPEMEATIFAPASEMANVTTDPRLRTAQMSALQKMTDQGTGGLNMKDMEALDQIKRNTAIQEHGNEEQIIQNMQQRGQAGSGAELAARLNSSQASANRASSEGLQVGATATQRALESIMNAGTLGGNIRGQDFSEESQKAKSQDVINQFNAANRQAVIARNTGSQNSAQAANLGNKQDIMNKNTGIANEQQRADAASIQQDYENRLRKAQGIYSANTNQANNLGAAAQRGNEAFSGTMNGIGQSVGAFATFKNQQDQNDQHKRLLDLLYSGGSGGGGASGSSGLFGGGGIGSTMAAG